MPRVSFLILPLLLSTILTSYAADKVVVIPLNKTINAALPSSSISVYDANNTFIGYLISEYNRSVISSKDFYTRLSNVGQTIVPSKSFSAPFFFADSNCNQHIYIDSGEVASLTIISDVRGYITYNANYPDDTNIYYIDLWSGLAMPPGTYYEQDNLGNCNPSLSKTQIFSVYEIWLNNPTVTGIENSYPGPPKTAVN